MKPLREARKAARKNNNAGVEMPNHVDRLFAAVSVLIGHGNIKQRLVHAFDDHLAGIETGTLPVALREPFADLKRLVTQVEPLNGEGTVCASVRKMSVHEAEECAKAMLRLYADLLRLADSVETMSLPGEQSVPAIIPPFLVKNGHARSG